MPVLCSPANPISAASTPALTGFFAQPFTREDSSTRSKSLLRRGVLTLLILLAALSFSVVSAHATTWTVTDTSDNVADTGSLRYALTHAVAGDNIVFGSLFSTPQTITLTSSLPAINISASGTLVITGPGPKNLTIDGNLFSYTAFTITQGSIFISGLTITNAAPAIIDNYELNVSDCTFIDNIAASHVGGAILASGPAGYLIVYNSTFIGNVGDHSGGAIEFAGGMDGTIADNTFSQNQSGSVSGIGGAIHVASGAHAGIENNTFYGNFSYISGGAIQIDTASSSQPSAVSNNIFYSNGGGGTAFTSTGFASADHNLYYQNDVNACVGCNPAETNAVVADPMLMPLGFYGGDTETMALLPGSAAICAGLVADDGGILADQRGWPLDPNCSSASNIDVGSIQTNQFLVNVSADDPTTATKDNCTPTSVGHSCTLRDAMLAARSASRGDITFASSLSGTTITLSTSPLATLQYGPDQVNIWGLGANHLTVSGNNDPNVGTIFHTYAGANTFIYGLTITGGTGFFDGGQTSYGGGIMAYNNVTVSNSAIVHNNATTTATNPYSYGGGIYLAGGNLTVIDSTISGNAASTGTSGRGGGIATNSGPGISLTIINSTISGNSATWWGGGIDDEGNTNLYSTTIANNQAGFNAGGIYLGAGTLTVFNSIVDGNSASSFNDFQHAGGSYFSSSSLIGTGSTTLATLGNYGGPTQTMIPLPGSAAICEGDPAQIYPGLTTDQRGYSNANVTYTGYSVASPCVDAGSVQTDYSVAFYTQPSNTSAGAFITPAPQVALTDHVTNPVNGVPLPITLSVGSGTLSGTLTQPTSGGEATYNDLSINQAGAGDELGVSLTVSPSGASDVITITATSDPFDVSGAFSKFAVSAGTPQQAGVPFSFTVTAEDSGSNTINGYNGTVHFTSSDPSATLPANYTFVAGDHGTHTFNATLVTLGGQTITATDTVDSNTGTSNSITVNAGLATHLTVTGYPSPVFQYTTNNGTVTAYDQYNNVATGFAGPVTISSSTDGTATITQPSSWSNGAATFSVNFDLSGTQSITASGSGVTSGSQTGIVVNAPPSYVVTTTSDDATGVPANCPSSSNCSLRDALAAAAASGTGNITFDPTIFGTPQTITLGSGGTLVIPPNTAITGTNSGSGVTRKNLVTIDGAGTYLIFQLNGGTLALIQNLIISNGNAQGNPHGGAIFNNGGTLTINRSTISGNQGDFTYGAGIYNSGTLTVDFSTFSGNHANNGYGGAIYNTGTLTLNGSTFSGNQANSGYGAGVVNVSELTVNNSTFSGNQAEFGGGIFNESDLTLSNAIVSGNTASVSSPDIYQGSTLNDNGGNVIGGTIYLAPLGNYGGPTQTMIELAESPAICGGIIANLLPGETTDQRGNPRTTTAYGPSCVDSGATQSAYSLSFTTEPAAQQVSGVTITPSPQVQILDNGVAIKVSGIDVAMQANLGTLSGTTLQTTNSNGIATFGDLSIAPAETGDSLTAKVFHNANFISVDSNTFNVVALTISPSSLPNATVGVSYSQSITANNGTSPYTFTVFSGSLPAGLTLSSGGSLSGTPTAGGSFSFTVQATDHLGATAKQNYTLTVNSATILVSPSTLPNGTYGTAYSQNISASGGTATYNYVVTGGTKPTGLTLNASTGLLSGTPTAVGTFNFTVTATDSSTGTGPYTGSRAYSVTIGKATATIHVTPYSVAFDGNPHTATATATGYNGVNLISEMNLSGTTHTLAGSYSSDSWTFTDTTGNYLNASGTITDVINKLSQTITFTPPFPTTGYTPDATFKLNATSTSGLTVSFNSTTPSVCAITTFGTPAVPAAKVLSAGNCIIQATQAGNSIYSAATPVLHTYTIVAALTNTTLSASSTTVKSGASETFTASVSSFVSGSLTGTVSFYDGATLLGTVSLSNGKAALTTSSLSVGTHNITADYNGSTDFHSSNSASVKVTVTP